MREEDDRDVNSKPLRFQETVPSSRHSSESRNLEDRQAASPSTKLPLPQGEGWGEGTAGIFNQPYFPLRRGKSLSTQRRRGLGWGRRSLRPYGMQAERIRQHRKSIIKAPSPPGRGHGVRATNESRLFIEINSRTGKVSPHRQQS